MRKSVFRGFAPAVAALLAGGCGELPDLPLGAQDLEVFWKHSDWRPRRDITFDPSQAAPSRVQRFATSTVVGDVKVIEGDSTVVSAVNMNGGTSGFGLRMDQNRQDLARITSQIIQEEGDHFDFVVVFPAFEDLVNPGFAYFSGIKMDERGTGNEPVDMSELFGSDTGRLQGFLNMNRPEAYTQVDGLNITDPNSSAMPIMGQELTHRWLAFATFRQDGFNNGAVSNALLGRDDAHWSALMHTGPADMSGDVYVSVQDGIAWQDNGNGTFTTAEVFSDRQFNISTKARFSTLDLYLMGLYTPEEVEPFYIINNARNGNQAVTATSVLPKGMTISGQRLDVTVQDVIAALGPRIPNAQDAQKDFNVAFVVVTRPGQTAADVATISAEVDQFRVMWEQTFATWTGGRATVCTALSGNCATSRLKMDGVQLEGGAADGTVLPGEALTLKVTVRNVGTAVSQPATLQVAVDAGSIEPARLDVPALEAGTAQEFSFAVVPAATTACGQNVRASVTLETVGVRASTVSVDRVLGVRTLLSTSMEEEPGWQINPDNTDTAENGAWARGQARQTDLRRYGAASVIIAPGDDVTTNGNQAFFTDPGTARLDPDQVGETDVDDGITTLQSAEINVEGLMDPVITVSTWHTALVIDFNAGELRDGEGDDLITQLSVNGGAFVEVDRDATNDFVWKRKAIRLAGVPGVDLAAARSVRLRFIIADVGEQNLVEAGVDELSITDLAPGCANPNGNTSSGGPGGNPGGGGEQPKPGVGGGSGAPVAGCTCAIPEQTTSFPLAVLLLGLGALTRTRRRA